MDSEEERIAVRGVGKKMAQFSGLFRHRKGSIIEGEEEEGEEGGDARGGNAAMLRQPKSMIDLGTRRQWSGELFHADDLAGSLAHCLALRPRTRTVLRLTARVDF